MKVFNLQCQFGHSFEGWFRSAEEFNLQKDKGLLICPACEDTCISRIPSAAHIQANKGSGESFENQVGKDNSNNVVNEEVKRKLLEVAEKILKDSENEVQNITNRFTSKIDGFFSKKEEEILTV